jgi:hypothetical protein
MQRKRSLKQLMAEMEKMMYTIGEKLEVKVIKSQEEKTIV